MANKFKVGDRVIGNEKADGRYAITRKGWCGVVTEVNGDRIRVKGPDRGGITAEYGVDSVYFDLDVDSRKIVITTDGKTTTARLFDGKELIKRAEAKCSPDDKFDFMVGAKLAMERLTGKKPQKPVNPFKVGDFVKIKSNKTNYHGFPVGSVGRVLKADDDGTCEVDGFYDTGIRGNQWVEIEELEKV
jgi:hypothetical protein